MHKIPDLLAAVQASYPDPIPKAQERIPGTGYSVAGAFIRYANEHNLLSYDDCHDLMMMPGNTPRYPAVGVVADVLMHVNPALSNTDAMIHAGLIVSYSRQGRMPLAYRALECALTQTKQEETDQLPHSSS